MRKVAIVIDSTANLPKDVLSQYKITTLPQTLVWGQQIYRDGVDITPDEFYARLVSSTVIPTTSQVTPAEFSQAFSQLLGQDYDVLAILVSEKLSGTMASAIQAKENLKSDRIQLIDSNTTSMAQGLEALETARAAADGASLSECVALAETLRNHTGVLFVVDTLKFLHLGGRIGGGARFLGTALNLKPVLELVNGRIEAIQRVVSKRKAIDRILDLVELRIAGRTPLHIATLHARAPEEAEALLDRAKERFHPVEGFVTELSPVVGVHVGPGTLGLAFLAGR
ncbi:MAG: DegV family protein [Anaerolineaceae bacterium]|nr:DegV family protein [Anaerolineaceae bacterium]